MTTETSYSMHLQTVLENQQAMSVARASIAQLRQAIADQQAKAGALRVQAGEVAALETQREDLLADIATGQDKAAELAALDKGLAQRVGDLAEQGTQAAIEQTVAGLMRKLGRAATELEQLEEQRPQLLRRLLNARAEALGPAYVEAAKKLRTLHDQLLCLNHLLMEQGQTHAMSMRSGLQVPAFSLDSVRHHAMTFNPTLLMDTARGTLAELTPAIVAEKAALRSLGVEIA